MHYMQKDALMLIHDHFYSKDLIQPVKHYPTFRFQQNHLSWILDSQGNASSESITP